MLRSRRLLNFSWGGQVWGCHRLYLRQDSQMVRPQMQPLNRWTVGSTKRSNEMHNVTTTTWWCYNTYWECAVFHQCSRLDFLKYRLLTELFNSWSASAPKRHLDWVVNLNHHYHLVLAHCCPYRAQYPLWLVWCYYQPTYLQVKGWPCQVSLIYTQRKFYLFRIGNR